MMRGVAEESRSQVGIGTLIILIAMVLVAAIAAGTLLNISNALQSNAEKTGEDAIKATTNGVTVISARGGVLSLSNELVLKSSSDDIAFGSVGGIDDQVRLQSGDRMQVAYIETGSSYTLYVGSEETNNTLEVGDVLEFRATAGGNIAVDDVTHGETPIVEATGPITLRGNADSGSGNIAEFVLNPVGQSEPDIHIDEQAATGVTDASVSLAADAGSKKYVGTVSLVLGQSPGAGNINLSKATVTYKSTSGIAHLTYTAGAPDADSFTVTPLTDSDTVLTTESDRVALELSANALEHSGGGLTAGATPTVTITASSGRSITVQLDVPNSLNGKTAVRL